MSDDLSPEDILREKELAGGIEYDKEEPNPLVARIRENEGIVNETPDKPNLGNVNENIPDTRPIYPQQSQSRPSLGKVDNTMRRGEVELDTGWKNLPLTMIPSAGLYFPEGTQIAIRAAEVVEIRHFSAIDENDKLGTTNELNYILDRCMRIQFPGSGVVEYLDLIQEDRFYIIMAIRDLTFIKGENKIILKPSKKCKSERECPFNDGFELRSGCLDFFQIDPEIMKYYSRENRCFEFRLKESPDELITMTIPTIGTKLAIKDFVNRMNAKRMKVDKAFLDIVPFILPDRREISFDLIYAKFREADRWSKEEFSLYFTLAKMLKIGTKIEASLECPVCHEEVKAPILFKNGIKSIFVISDIFRQLL